MPPVPEVADPEAKNRYPLHPKALDPVERVISPETPSSATLPELTNKGPDDAAQAAVVPK
jgi:hypothetical protein